jgi:hypothetical protein
MVVSAPNAGERGGHVDGLAKDWAPQCGSFTELAYSDQQPDSKFHIVARDLVADGAVVSVSHVICVTDASGAW